MKKTILIAAIGLIAVSCKKNYYCECQTNGRYDKTMTFSTKTYSEAKTKCQNAGQVSTSFTTECHLK